jgi:transposase-like protein
MAVDEEDHLAQADRHIAEAEQHIADQEQKIADLDTAGSDTAQSRRMLSAFRGILEQMHIHREMIIARLAGA